MRVKDNQKPFKREQKAQKQESNNDLLMYYYLMLLIICVAFVVIGVSISDNQNSRKIKIVSMDFNIKQKERKDQWHHHHYGVRSARTARWDLLIRVPGKLVGNYMCLQGNLQATFLYKNVVIATSSIQSYNKLEAGMPHLLSVSAVASEEDFSGVIGKEIMEAMKEKKEVRFGTRLSLTDCREVAEKSTMSFECDDETRLRFEPSSSDEQVNASAFGKRPTCEISRL